jgi:hypothetical protein
MNQEKGVTLLNIFKFWLPLSLNWQMMALEGPVIAAMVARLSEPELQLAAFGVAFAWALIIESPVIPLLSASAALCRDAAAFYNLRRFMWQLCGLSTALQLLFIWPPVFNLIVDTLLGLPPPVAASVHQASCIMLPWSAAIGYRRFYQGIMIRGGMPRKVAFGTAVRMVTMLTVAATLYQTGILPGASAACLTLVSAVSAEAVASRIMATPALKLLLASEPSDITIGYGALIRFYTPLALSVLLGMGVQPLTTLALGRAPLPLESLAALPVVNSLIFFISTSTNALQETTIVLVGDRLEHRNLIRNFSLLLGFTLTMLLVVITYTSLGRFWFESVMGLPQNLIPLAFIAAQMGVIMPLLRSWESYQRALMVKAHETVIVTVIAVLEIAIIGAALFYLTQVLGMVGVVAAPLSLAIAAAAAIFLLLFANRRAVSRVNARSSLI